jgi:cellulose synthase/poly-beta-1,6-N-acetylglucosamine synthase-like glycosyltransferase
LFITAFNEEDIVNAKMENCRNLIYPKDKLHIVWVTDGSDDRTNELLSAYQDVTVYYQPQREGKMAAMNRGIQFVNTPYVVFTDANTMLNAEAVTRDDESFPESESGMCRW